MNLFTLKKVFGIFWNGILKSTENHWAIKYESIENRILKIEFRKVLNMGFWKVIRIQSLNFKIKEKLKLNLNRMKFSLKIGILEKFWKLSFGKYSKMIF